MQMKKIVWISFFLLLFFEGADAVDPPKREIRGVWLTTIYGLDWPDRPAQTERERQEQQQQICSILDRLQDANFNTVFLQVRLRGDVIWRSAIEPASKVFSGRYGTMPGYDPLAFVVEECHKRGLECHAWFVTFPVGTMETVREQGRLSVVKRHPELCKRHNGEWYLDPGVPATADYLLSLIKELVNGYDIDGIHFDYIRYPEQADKFPDKASFRKYGHRISLNEWRRENINRMMARFYDWVKSAKPWVQVSSSPLGKYSRIPRMPNAGWTAYESVHQDPERWMRQGKQDLVVPMMYYLQDNFFPFVDNWVENSHGRLIVPGLGAYRMLKEEADWELNDLTDQIDYSRYFGGAGVVFFRCAQIVDNTKGIYDELKTHYYRYPALLPPLNWLNPVAPEAPKEIEVILSGNELKLSWNKPAVTDEVTYTVYYSQTDTIDYTLAKHVLITGVRDTSVFLPVDVKKEQGFLFSVSASTRYHVESIPSRETYYYLSGYPK